MKTCCTGLEKLWGVVRILLGLGMLYFGLSKLGKLPDILAIGEAAHALGFTFFSVVVRGWIAIVGEILSGIFLLFGCRSFGVKMGSFMTAIIMIFALSFGMPSMGIAPWTHTVAWVFLVVAFLVLVLGGGCWTMGGHKKSDPCCKGGKCRETEVVEV